MSISLPSSKALPPYDPRAIEARWREEWAASDAFAAPEQRAGETASYVHTAHPFTSGEAHMGHVRSYTIADAHARFRRARGEAVLLAIGFDALGLPTETEAIKRRIPPHEVVEESRETMRRQLSALGYSFDWNRSFVTSDDITYRWSQRLFLLLLEHGFIYLGEATVDWCANCQTVLARTQIEDGGCWRCHGQTELIRRPQWFLRTSAYLEEDDERLDELHHWDKRSISAQRSLLGKTIGVEFDAAIGGGPSLTLFTPHGDHIAEAAFVAISPMHAQIDDLALDPETMEKVKHLRSGGWAREDREAEVIPLVETHHYVAIPSVDRMLPLIVTPSVDARFGVTAVAGIPSQDKTDKTFASRLADPLAMKVKASKRNLDVRPAVRYSAGDYPVSRQRAWGSPIPIIHCPDCGIVPVRPSELPVLLPEDLEITGAGNPLRERTDFLACSCPVCDQDATRETDTLDCHFDSLWMWFAVCVPPEQREEGMFDSDELKRWLPVVQVVWGVDGTSHLASQRSVAKMLRDIGVLAHIPSGEPFQRVLFHDMVQLEGRKMSKHLGNTVTPDQLMDEFGADALRLTVLYAAAPRKSFYWNDGDLNYCSAFLQRLWHYTHPHFAGESELASADLEFDTSTKLRRRLVKWVSIATEKITNDYESVSTHRAVRNCMLLLARIEDFERQALNNGSDGELSEEDQAAVGWALRHLIRLLAPMAPYVAEELWSLSGGTTFVMDAGWPEPRQVKAQEHV